MHHQSSEFGFFLSVPKFRDAVLGFTSYAPSPALLSTVYLWGVHLSESDHFAQYESAFLSLSLRSTAENLSGAHPQKIVHGIQAEILLAYYFLRSGRVMEAKYHTSAAVSLALSSGLGRIRTADQSSDLLGHLGPPTVLPPPLDPMEEGERIHGLWAVLTLNNTLAAADRSPSNISYTSPGARIDTPWPLDLEMYSEVDQQPLHPAVHSSVPQHTLPPDFRSSGTIIKFLANVQDNENSIPALHAKAAILFEQATLIASQYRPSTFFSRRIPRSFPLR